MKRIILDSTGVTWGNHYWSIWLAVLLLTFLAPEAYGLATNSANTLSAWVWRALKISSHESFIQWSAMDFLMFGVWTTLVVWLTGHFFFGIFR